MDEYEKLEQDLKRQYESFVQKFISLSYLENQLDDYDRHEQEKMAEREVSVSLWGFTRKGRWTDWRLWYFYLLVSLKSSPLRGTSPTRGGHSRISCFSCSITPTLQIHYLPTVLLQDLSVLQIHFTRFLLILFPSIILLSHTLSIHSSSFIPTCQNHIRIAWFMD